MDYYLDKGKIGQRHELAKRWQLPIINFDLLVPEKVGLVLGLGVPRLLRM